MNSSSTWASCQIHKIVGCICAGNIFPATTFGDLYMHHGTCVRHVPWCMAESLTSGLLRIRWWGKHSWHSQHMRNLQFYVTSKRPMGMLQIFAMISALSTIYSLYASWGNYVIWKEWLTGTSLWKMVISIFQEMLSTRTKCDIQVTLCKRWAEIIFLSILSRCMLV